MKFRHNKKRNTAFLFEILIQELTKSVVASDADKKEKVIKIIKENFNKNTTLGKELILFKTILGCSRVTPRVAEKVFAEARFEYIGLNKEEIFESQTKLISQINKDLSKDVFSNFISDYKFLASIQQLFNEDIKFKERALLEEGVIRKLLVDKKEDESKQIPSDVLVYQNFVNKYNNKYESLDEQQRTLLNKYIISFADNGLEFKIFLNEELYRLKGVIKEATVKNEDDNTVVKFKKIMSLVDDFKNEKINIKLVEKILKIQSLVKEVI